MNKEQAEARIVVLCREIDEARLRNDKNKVALIKAEIAELKKITGPRYIHGVYGGKGPNG